MHAQRHAAMLAEVNAGLGVLQLQASRLQLLQPSVDVYSELTGNQIPSAKLCATRLLLESAQLLVQASALLIIYGVKVYNPAATHDGKQRHIRTFPVGTKSIYYSETLRGSTASEFS